MKFPSYLFLSSMDSSYRSPVALRQVPVYRETDYDTLSYRERQMLEILRVGEQCC